MVCRRELARLELLRTGAGFHDLGVAASARDEIYDHAPVFFDDDELCWLTVVVGVPNVDVELVLATVMPMGADDLEGLFLGDRVPRHLGQYLLRFDGQQLPAGCRLFLLQRHLELGEDTLCLSRPLIVGAGRKTEQQHECQGARNHVADIGMSQAGTGADCRGILSAMPFRLPVLVACLAFAAGELLAQAPTVVRRGGNGLRPTFGRVVDKDDKPVADGVVTFIGGLPHLLPSLQDIHVVKVGTDRRGRAMARLRPGLCYVAWANGPTVAGKRAGSDVRGYFAAGAMFDLVCGEAVPLATCELRGEEKWQHVGELRYFAMTSMPGTDVELQRGADGSFELPGKPFDVFEVRLPDGQALWHSRIRSELLMPPPQQIKVRAVDPKGAPVAGAKVRHRVGRLSSWRLDGLRSVGEDRMRLLGATDADGFCTVQVPYATDPLKEGRDNLLLFVEAEGCPSVAGGIWSRSNYVSDRKVPKFEGDVLSFECAKVEPLLGVLPEAPAGTIAHFAAVCKLHLQRNSYLHDARVFTAEVSADGTFVLDDVPAELHSSRLSFLTPSGSTWQPPVFAPEANRELPVELLPRPSGAPLPTELIPMELTVVGPSGGPARGAVAFLSSGDRHGILLRDSLLRVALDERGSARLRLVPGSWVVVVMTEDGFCGEQLQLDMRNQKAQIALGPLAAMTVTLRDELGKPVVGATVRSRGTSTRGTNDPVSSILQGLSSTTNTRWKGLRTDAAGVVTVPFVPVEGVRQRVELRWRGGRSEELVLLDGEKLTINPVAERREPRRRR